MVAKKSLSAVYTLGAALVVLLSGTVELFAADDSQPFSRSEREFLVKSLVSDRFEKGILNRIFFDRRLQKYPIVITRNVYNKENRRNYEDFYSAYSFKMADRFSRKWRTVLRKASEQFEVDKEVLVAILLVETGLGNVLGRFPVISVFSSIIVEHANKSREYASLQNLTEEQAYVLSRLTLKAEWAYEELSALLMIAKTNNQSPFRFRGSFAGAFGIPQFLPSSYLKWGYDSDKNGTVNLFLMPDAVYSTANYLKAHGWKKGLYRESNKEVIYKYNNSKIYVDTVLNIAKKIKTSHNSKTKISEQTRLDRSHISRGKETTS
ncbi:MAG: lytic murein transglycosylase [Proteobacteria bacterium]|nr:lytic murein transglycosylase [Pseudomonadota bacterium]